MLFPLTSPATTSDLLTEKYRPADVASFIGLDKAKRLASKLLARPMDCALLFVGASGTGKTTLARAIAAQMPAELHHIASQNCNVAEITRVHLACQYMPGPGKRKHVVLIDEADLMSTAAQNALLSILDGTNPAPDTIWVFTCNDASNFETRFRSRCIEVEFSSYGIAKDATALLADVWEREANGAAAPNFARIVKESNNNVRAALMELQKELMFA